MEEKEVFRIGISLLPRIGPKTAKKLLAYCGSAEAVFREKKAALLKIPGIGPETVKTVINQTILKRAEEELRQIEKRGIKPVFFSGKEYPFRLKHCEDGPIILYKKGNLNLNEKKVIAIVGTRRASDYGIRFCEELVEGLKGHRVLVISGLAYGIDIHAHRAAMKNGLGTAAVLAHGLDRIYPPVHARDFRKMSESGALLSEYRLGTLPEKKHFPQRNRIVAGMADAVVVVESPGKGGSLITASLANSYNRDVFAVPGNLGRRRSEGCNWLIKTHQAALIENVKDVEYIMGWEREKKESSRKTKSRQLELQSMSDDVQKVYSALEKNEELGIEKLALLLKLPVSKAASLLLELELKGLIRALPGNRYSAV